jgi:hypothetical protein
VIKNPRKRKAFAGILRNAKPGNSQALTPGIGSVTLGIGSCFRCRPRRFLPNLRCGSDADLRRAVLVLAAPAPDLPSPANATQAVATKPPPKVLAAVPRSSVDVVYSHPHGGGVCSTWRGRVTPPLFYVLSETSILARALKFTQTTFYTLISWTAAPEG